MKYEPVSLDRYFTLAPKSETDSDEQELRSIWNDQKRTGWSELEEEFRCVILAEAGAGKSYEMEARAKHAEALGRVAFFIRIEDIEDGFEAAFEVGSAEVFERWLHSKEEAWFFLDSIDEARLENPRAFEKAIKRFSTRIKPADQRARVFISSRPYAWRARSDRELVEQYLPCTKLKSEKAGDRNVDSEEIDAKASWPSGKPTKRSMGGSSCYSTISNVRVRGCTRQSCVMMHRTAGMHSSANYPKFLGKRPTSLLSNYRGIIRTPNIGPGCGSWLTNVPNKTQIWCRGPRSRSGIMNCIKRERRRHIGNSSTSPLIA